MSENVKRCPRCEESFPLTSEYWNRDARRPTGFATYCRPCDHAKRNDRRARNTTDEYRARERERMRRYRASKKAREEA